MNNDLINQIIDKSEKLSIPYILNNNFIGFGKYENFYLFWVYAEKDEIIFKARIKYKFNSTSNLITLTLKEENINEILNAVDNIYNDYLNKKINNESNQNNLVLNCSILN